MAESEGGAKSRRGGRIHERVAAGESEVLGACSGIVPHRKNEWTGVDRDRLYFPNRSQNAGWLGQ